MGPKMRFFLARKLNLNNQGSDTLLPRPSLAFHFYNLLLSGFMSSSLTADLLQEAGYFDHRVTRNILSGVLTLDFLSFAARNFDVLGLLSNPPPRHVQKLRSSCVELEVFKTNNGKQHFATCCTHDFVAFKDCIHAICFWTRRFSSWDELQKSSGSGDCTCPLAVLTVSSAPEKCGVISIILRWR